MPEPKDSGPLNNSELSADLHRHWQQHWEKPIYETWLKPLRVAYVEKGVVYIAAPNDTFCNWFRLTKNQHSQLTAQEDSSKFVFETDHSFSGVEIINGHPKPAVAEEPPEIVVPIPRSKRESDCPAIPDGVWTPLGLAYRDAVGGCTEASDNFHFAVFHSAVAALLGRSVHYFMGRTIYPNLWIALFGKSGKARKGTAMTYGADLLHRVTKEVQWLNSLATWEGLLSVLYQRQQGAEERKSISALCALGELRSMIDKANTQAGQSLVPNLSDAYDCPDTLEHPVKNNPIKVYGPFLQIIGAASPKWVEGLKAADLEGGLGNRFLWIPGVRKPKIKKFRRPALALFVPELQRLTKYWQERAKETEHNSVEFTLSPEAETAWDKFSDELEQLPYDDALTEALHDRYETQTIKIALQHAACEMGEPVIRPEHLRPAIAFAGFGYQSLRYIFSDFNMSVEAKQEQQILDYVRECGDKGAHHRAMQQHFGYWGAELFNRRLKWLLRDGQRHGQGKLWQDNKGTRSTFYFLNE